MFFAIAGKISFLKNIQMIMFILNIQHFA